MIEAVDTQESMMQAIGATRPGGHVGYVGVAHDVTLPGDELLLLGHPPARRAGPRPAVPARTHRPIWNGKINPGKVCDLQIPLDEVGEGYKAMDERRAIKTLLTV